MYLFQDLYMIRNHQEIKSLIKSLENKRSVNKFKPFMIELLLIPILKQLSELFKNSKEEDKES